MELMPKAFPEMPAEVETRYLLTSAADQVISRVSMLYSPLPNPRAYIEGLKAEGLTLRSLCAGYGSPSADLPGILECAEQIKSLTIKLAQAEPKLGSPYYLSHIVTAVKSILSTVSPQCEAVAPAKPKQEKANVSR